MNILRLYSEATPTSLPKANPLISTMHTSTSNIGTIRKTSVEIIPLSNRIKEIKTCRRRIYWFTKDLTKMYIVKRRKLTILTFWLLVPPNKSKNPVKRNSRRKWWEPTKHIKLHVFLLFLRSHSTLTFSAVTSTWMPSFLRNEWSKVPHSRNKILVSIGLYSLVEKRKI